MKWKKEGLESLVVPIAFIAFLVIAADLLVEFITEEPIIAFEGIRWAIVGMILLAIIGVFAVLDR